MSWTVQTEKYLPLSLSQEGQPCRTAAAKVKVGWRFWSHLSRPSFLNFTSCVGLRVFTVLLSLDIFKTGKVRMCRSTQRGVTFRFTTASDHLTDPGVQDGKCDFHRIKSVTV